MGFVHSTTSRIFINEDHISAAVTGWKFRHARAYAEVPVITDSGYRYLPGLLSGGFTIDGLYDSAAGGIDEEMSTVIGTDDGAVITAFPDGVTVGQPALFCVGDVAGYEIPSSVSEAVRLSIDAAAGDGVDRGHSLHAHAAETADGNSTGVDNAASSANGGAATLHVTAYSGFTSVVFTVQHSTDNSSWADLITFTTATGTTQERKAVTGTVNRYVRGFWDVTGSGSVTFVMAFGRR